jgi:hypothetical protein
MIERSVDVVRGQRQDGGDLHVISLRKTIDGRDFRAGARLGHSPAEADWAWLEQKVMIRATTQTRAAKFEAEE